MAGFGLSSRAIIGTFYQTLEEAFGAGWASKIAMLMSSNQESETYKWLGMVPAMRQWVGGRQPKGLRENGLTIVNKLWEDTLEIDVDDLRRDKTGQIKVRIQELADKAAQHWESLLSTLIANGTGTTSGLAYDGHVFFDTDHSEGDSGTLLNALAAGQVAALNVATETAPTQAEMASAILGCIAYMLGFKDDRGEPIHGSAREFLVMVPVGLAPAALAAANQNILLAASGNTLDNPLKSSPFRVDVAVNARLTWTTDFAIFRTDGRTKPFIMQEETPVKMEVIGEGSEEEIKNRRHLYGISASRNVGYGMWQHAAKATLS